MSESSFTKLAAINVNDKIEKKNGLSYLSWAWAWDQLLRADPDATFAYPEPKMFGETMMVYCTVTAFGKARTAHLPVMDHRNKPISNPDAFQVNTAMQRCLVKAIAFHGLGLYIYAGEDLPEGEAKPEPENGMGKGPRIPATVGAWEAMDADMQVFLQDIADNVHTLFRRKDAQGAWDEVESHKLKQDALLALWSRLESPVRTALKKIGPFTQYFDDDQTDNRGATPQERAAA